MAIIPAASLPVGVEIGPVAGAITAAIGGVFLLLLGGRAIETDETGLTIRRRFSERRFRWEELADFGTARGNGPLVAGTPTIYLKGKGQGLPEETVKLPSAFALHSRRFSAVMADHLKATAGANLLAMIGSGRIDLGAVQIDSEGVTVQPTIDPSLTIPLRLVPEMRYKFAGSLLKLVVPAERKPIKVHIQLIHLSHIAALIGYLENPPAVQTMPPVDQ